MEIRSAFGSVATWDEVAPGVAFYTPENDRPRLGMKILLLDHETSACLFFDPEPMLVEPKWAEGRTLLLLEQSALVPLSPQRLGGQAQVGVLTETAEGLLINVHDEKRRSGASVDLKRGRYVHDSWPTAFNASVCFPEWKIVLPHPLESEDYQVLASWPLRD